MARTLTKEARFQAGLMDDALDKGLCSAALVRLLDASAANGSRLPVSVSHKFARRCLRKKSAKR